ncbi:MAG: chemotaxis protein CheX [Myxococcota bacterium]
MLNDELVTALVGAITETVLGSSPDPEPPDAQWEELGYRGLVTISGSWSGQVAFWCSPALARRVAATMFGCAEAEVPEADLCDAVGELANITGGNLKALLEPPSVLSVPAVALEPAPAALRFGLGGQPFAVEVSRAA